MQRNSSKPRTMNQIVTVMSTWDTTTQARIRRRLCRMGSDRMRVSSDT
jgi:hypothetical protein